MTEEKEQNQEAAEEEKSPLANFLEQFKAMSAQKKKGFIAFIMISFAAMIYFIFFSGDVGKKTPIVKNTITNTQIKPTEPSLAKIDNSEIMAANKPKELNPPAPPAPPAPPPPLEPIKEEVTAVLPQTPAVVEPLQVTPPQLPVPRARKDAKDLASEAKASGISMTNIMTFGSGVTANLKDDKNQAKDDAKDSSNFLGFDGGLIDNSSLKKTSAKTISATKINNSLVYTIVQGKVIDAVLETAINTQLQAGVIRAIVSRDIYGEQGDIILIPKGSRLVGSYSSSSSVNSSKAVLTRVFAGWNRIITPNGMDINLSNTPAADALGRNGIPGYVDTNLSNNLINAFLVSVLGPYLAAKATGLSNKKRKLNYIIEFIARLINKDEIR